MSCTRLWWVVGYYILRMYIIHVSPTWFNVLMSHVVHVHVTSSVSHVSCASDVYSWFVFGCFLCDFRFGSARSPFYSLRSVVAHVKCSVAVYGVSLCSKDSRATDAAHVPRSALWWLMSLHCCCVVYFAVLQRARLKPHLPHARLTRISDILKDFAFQGCRLGVTHLLRQLGHAGPRCGIR